MITLVGNTIVVGLYWGYIGSNSNISLTEIATHIYPLCATFIDFCFNRVVFEHNQSWFVTLYVLIYGLCILFPVSTNWFVVYTPLTFDDILSWILAIGLVATAPIIFFILYGIQYLKFVYIYRDAPNYFAKK